jgi:hypothetical protein
VKAKGSRSALAVDLPVERALLTQAAADFDALLTAGQNIEFQQNLKTLPIASLCSWPRPTGSSLLNLWLPKFFGFLRSFNPWFLFA